MNELERPSKVVIPQELKQLFDWYREEIVKLKIQKEYSSETIHRLEEENKILKKALEEIENLK